MIKNDLKISVIVPTYNRASMLGRCIESVLTQHWVNLELIIVNDGGTDNTKETVLRYNDPRLVYIEKENGGQASARNVGFFASTGDAISLCDDDDLFYPDHLYILASYLLNKPETDLVYSDALWRHENKENASEVKFSQDFDKKSLENFNYIAPLNVLFRKTCLSGNIGFNEDPAIKGLEDWLFFLELSDSHTFSHIKAITCEYRVHQGNSFQAESGYDYNHAFLTVRSKRFRYLIERFGTRIFDHTDHMYPFHLVQCFLNNGKYKEAHHIASTLNSLYETYCRHENKAPFTGLLIRFSAGISAFALGYKDRAETCFRDVREKAAFSQIAPDFLRFVKNYTQVSPNAALKKCLFLCYELR